MIEPSHADRSTRFLFDAHDARGELVQLDNALQDLLAPHDYGSATRKLLGEFAAAVVLISNNLKYTGRITLQARSSSQLSLIMVECTSESEIRGIAQGDTAAVVDNPTQLIADGQLVITIERDNGQRYQGIIALEGHSLAKALDHYFLQSEQLQTHFWLAADGERAAGIMLQQLPAQLETDADDRAEQWQTLEVLADTVTETELLDIPTEALLYRLFHDYTLRVFEPKPVIFHCQCSKARCQRALATLGTEEIESLLEEQGTITMHCEMCGTGYELDRNDLVDTGTAPVLH
jgi:molecular chaperone Hsp33